MLLRTADSCDGVSTAVRPESRFQKRTPYLPTGSSSDKVHLLGRLTVSMLNGTSRPIDEAANRTMQRIRLKTLLIIDLPVEMTISRTVDTNGGFRGQDQLMVECEAFTPHMPDPFSLF